jgi:hypothetical protein
MSYDIYLRGEKCDKCGHAPEEPDLPNPTYNLTPIFDLALTGEPLPNADVPEGHVVLLGAKTDRPRGLRLLSGRKASDTKAMLANALARLRDPAWHDRFVALEPSNKWGDLKGAVRVLEKLAIAADEYPGNVWEIH